MNGIFYIYKARYLRYTIIFAYTLFNIDVLFQDNIYHFYVLKLLVLTIKRHTLIYRL